MINGRGDNGRSCVMCQVTHKALRTWTKCLGRRFMVAFDALSFLGFQISLNEGRFEALCDSIHYYCSYYCPKYKAQKKYVEVQNMSQKEKIKLHCYLQTKM